MDGMEWSECRAPDDPAVDRVRRKGRIEDAIVAGEDHVLFLDMGPVDDAQVVVQSLEKVCVPVERKAVVV